MGFRDINLWKFGIFKNIKGLFSSPQHAATCIYWSEDGIISKHNLQLDTGYVSLDKIMKTWIMIQALKFRVQGMDIPVMMITPRSYIPFNPKRKLTKEERESLAKLDDMSDVKYVEAFTRVSEENAKNQNHQLLRTVLYGTFIVTAIIVIIVLVKA